MRRSNVAVISAFLLLFLEVSTAGDAAQSMRFVVAVKHSQAEPSFSVTLTNTDAVRIEVPQVPIRELVAPVIIDSGGRVITPTRWHSTTDSLVPTYLKPGETLLLRGGSSQQWLTLSDWGYPGLPAGSYTIMVKPSGYLADSENEVGTMRSGEVMDTFATASSSSNILKFTI